MNPLIYDKETNNIEYVTKLEVAVAAAMVMWDAAMITITDGHDQNRANAFKRAMEELGKL